MKTWLAIIALLLALLLAVPVLGEPGDKPSSPWEYLTPTEIARLEALREEQIVGGVKGSPYLLWQAYLGSGSIDLRLYEVSEPIFPRQLLFKERVRYAGNPYKTLTLTAAEAAQHVEMRIDRASLAALDRAGIEQIVVRSVDGTQVAQYACADVTAIFDYFALEESDTLCLQGEDAPLHLIDADGYRKAVSVN